MNGLRVISTAYACEPDSGSEPGIGWNIVREVARHHELWVITRANNRPAIEAALEQAPAPNLHMIYFDLPRWAGWWKRGRRGLQLYYYLWQWGAYRRVRTLHRRQPFDLAHHVTFGRYWNPSFLPLLGLPFVWGPVGGGESMPSRFRQHATLRGKLYETVRDAARWAGERDPFVRLAARRCSVGLPATPETDVCLKRLGVARTVCLGNAALNREELHRLAQIPAPPAAPIRFVSIGRLLEWKGFQLGLEAFARTPGSGAEYWIIGDGPQKRRLSALAHQLGVADRVTFWGRLPREETLARLRQCHALVHPSLHDSGGWVCVEAMAAGRPVLCLQLGGPGLLVTPETGYCIAAEDARQAVEGLAEAMTRLLEQPQLSYALGRRARRRAGQLFTWEEKANVIHRAYIGALARQSCKARYVVP